jgi:hypothetical protein
MRNLFILAAVLGGMNSCAAFGAAHGLNSFIDKAIGHKVDIVYLADPDHINARVQEALREAVIAIASSKKGFDCLLLEADPGFYQSALEAYQNGEKTWENSVAKADQAWKQRTGRDYELNKDMIDSALKNGLKVFAVDWSDSSPRADEMKKLFAEGFGKKRKASLVAAFQIGVAERNQVMANNIQRLMQRNPKTPGKCNKAVMKVGLLHLKTRHFIDELGVGIQKYTPIAHFLSGSLKTRQATISIYNCAEMIGPTELSSNCQRPSVKTNLRGVLNLKAMDTSPPSVGTILVN